MLILPCFANAQQGDLHIYDLKNNSFEVKNFSKSLIPKQMMLSILNKMLLPVILED